jgi:hypothetical protein
MDLQSQVGVVAEMDLQRQVESRSADCHNSNKTDRLAVSQHRNLDIAP